MKHKVALICPIYNSRNHFEFGHKFLQSKIDNHIAGDFYFIFSSSEQRDTFYSQSSKREKGEFFGLILPESERGYKSQVTVKKFYGLRTLMHRYDYMLVLDSECRFIKQVDISDKCEEIWKEKTFLNANISPDGFGIMRSCFKTLGLYRNPILRRETGNFIYNNWFNEIPIYKGDLLPEFFKWIDSLYHEEYKNNWYCFEYYMFTAFLIIEKGYKIKRLEYESLGGIMEYLYVFDNEKRKEIQKKFNSHWVSSVKCIDDNAFILFHLDRDLENEAYHINDFTKHIRNSKINRIKLLLKDFFLGEKRI